MDSGLSVLSPADVQKNSVVFYVIGLVLCGANPRLHNPQYCPTSIRGSWTRCYVLPPAERLLQRQLRLLQGRPVDPEACDRVRLSQSLQPP
jgi:hypothetical protein